MIPNEFTGPVHNWLGWYAMGYRDFQFMIWYKYGQVETLLCYDEARKVFNLYPEWW